MAIGATYHIMRRLVKLRQTDPVMDRTMQGATTVVYYQIPSPLNCLAVVRYTAYGLDGMPVGVCEDLYFDTPDDFCRLEQDIETALSSGIDASIASNHEYEIFPVIDSYLKT